MAIGLCAAIIMPAQDVPVLPPDSAIRYGTLPNGMSYYIVSNPTIKGLADFALVQKTGTGNIPDSASFLAVSTARDALDVLPRCTAPSLQDYFTSHGAAPGRDGFVRVSESSTEFRFENILLDRPETIDSTLLVLLDVTDRVSTTRDTFLRKWYSPSDQAVIVSGDVDASAVEYKLKMISMMTPAVKSEPRMDYVWRSRDSARYVRLPEFSDDLAVISATWESARMPKEYMNTVQPTIYEMFLAELAMVTEEGLKRGLRSKGIPVSDVSCSFVTSAQSAGDESFTVRFSVAPEHFYDAVAVLSDVISKVDAGNTSHHDLARMKQRCTDAVHAAADKPIRNNSDYVDKCVTAFLYNGSLSNLRTKTNFLSSRQLPDTTELRLFNGISSALLDPEKNLTLRYVAMADPDSVKAVFDSVWYQTKTVSDRRIYSVEDIPQCGNLVPKLKIRSTRTDPMSKASVWTFSNGFTVVYRRMDTDGRLYYNLALNGGYSSIQDLGKGEGGYVSDYFLLGRFGDMSGEDFVNVLNKEGVSMDAYVGLSNMMISGYAPKEKAGLMMRALLASVNSRTRDVDAEKYHAECLETGRKAMAGTRQERIVAIDSIMCKNYKYSSVRGLDVIPDDLPEKADRFFACMAEKSNDGVLVLLGDMDETQLKKVLLGHVGGFRVTDKAFRRPVVRYQPATGWSTYTVAGSQDCVDIAMSSPLILSADNYMAAEIASMVLLKHLSESVIGTGMYVTMSHECRIYPQERFNVMISLSQASPDGFSSSTVPSGAMEALSIVRAALDDIPGIEVSDAMIKTLKQQLKGGVALEMKGPFYWLNVISRRYLAGKDFTTGYESKIDSVTPAKVKEILSALNGGSKVEYITSRN